MKLIALLLLLFLLSFSLSTAQQYQTECTGHDAWLPVGNDLPGRAIDATILNQQLYVLHYQNSSDPYPLHVELSRWDGVRWNSVVNFSPSIYGSLGLGIIGYKNSIYLGGTFSDVDKIPGTRGIARWDGQSWGAVGGGVNSDHAGQLEVYKGELYVAGNFTQAGDIQANSIARWNGVEWKGVGGGVRQSVADDYQDPYTVVDAMHAANGVLYINGRFDTAGRAYAHLIAQWDGSEWSGLGDSPVETWPIVMFGFNSELFIYNYQGSVGSVPGSRFMKWDGHRWSSVWEGIDPPIGAMVTYDGDLYTAGGTYVLDPTTNDSIFRSVARWDGVQWHAVSGFDYPVRLIADGENLFAYGKMRSSCGTPLTYVARICTEDNCAKVSGNLFHDLNGDCINDPGDQGLKGRVVEFLPGPHYAITDSNGGYNRILSLGSYTVTPTPYLYWNIDCPVPSAAHRVTISTLGEHVSGQDFGFNPTPGIRDMRVSIAGDRPRPGFQITYTIKYQNVGTEPLTGTIKLTHDSRLMFDSSGASTTRYTPHIAEWEFANLPVGESRVIRAYMRLARDVELGSTLCAYIDVDLQEADQLLGDNRDSLCEEVRGSYDPNDIVVRPEGNGARKTLSPSDTVLTYHIRFQNTGNDTAFTVVVVDTLSEYLDITTLKLGATSHPYRLTINESGALAWTFDNIMLPDSHVNEVASHGYLKYSVHLKPGLAANTQIPNRAGIYFDYNAPVITNTVVSTIGGAEYVEHAEGIRVYPNPTGGRLVIEAEMARGQVVVIETVIGERMRKYSSDGSARMDIDLSMFPVGMYLVRAETTAGVVIEQVYVIR